MAQVSHTITITVETITSLGELTATLNQLMALATPHATVQFHHQQRDRNEGYDYKLNIIFMQETGN